MEILFTIYGMSFFALGLAALLHLKIKSSSLSIPGLFFLALYGFTHGLFEFAKAVLLRHGRHLSGTTIFSLELTGLSFLILSFAALFLFGIEITPPLNRWPKSKRWILPTFLLLFLLTSLVSFQNFQSNNSLHWLESLSRYLLGFPACLLAAIGLFYHGRETREAHEARLVPYFYTSALLFIVYGITEGLLQPGVPQGEPLVYLHLPTFEVYFLRFICGFALSGIFIHLLIFEIMKLQKMIAQMREEYIGVISHDIRSALTSAALGSELLEKLSKAKRDPEKQLTLTHTIRKNISKAVTIMNDLHDASCLETKKLPMRPIEFDLVATLKNEIGELNSLIADRHFKLELPTSAAPIRGDQRRIQQALTNLLMNAIKYSPPQSEIISRIEIALDQVLVSIQNTGKGIPPRELPHIFEKYFRTSNASEQASGSGLGLYIVKEIVEANGGSVSANSIQGETTRFSLSFPVINPQTS